MSTHTVITPPARIGILGGGQLGRYFVMAARTMGYATTVVDPDPSAPAGKVADHHIVAAYDDPVALEQLAVTCAVVTTEFENAPAAALRTIADRVTVNPSPDALEICQDRIREKAFLEGIGAPVGPYTVLQTDDDLHIASVVQFPAIIKTARLGYDGKGQREVETYQDLAAAWDELGRVPCVVEQKLALDRELSVVVARTEDGRTCSYAVAQNQHLKGVLDVSWAPAYMPADSSEQAAQVCTWIAEELHFVGVMCVEMFIVGSDVYINEIAPRPHNTGHYTLDVCVTSQFEQQVRAVCGLALGETRLLVPGVAMLNLMGDLWTDGEPKWQEILQNPAVALHLYGKAEARPGRKMGHMTVATGTAMGATALGRRLRKMLTD
ncbi:MAG: 5-(carboxyamino)imidazole ribonucleotide synthase [Ilumatobacteraceae bacterium]